MIPVSKPSLCDDEVIAVKSVFESGWLGLGANVKKFEEEVCNYLNAPRFLATCNGTAALHLALRALGIGPGDEVIVPSFTFIASIQAITASGANPVFCDIDPDTLNIDVNQIEPLISKSTKAIMPVHYRGLPCDMERILKISEMHHLYVIEDAAHAFGSFYKDRQIGSFGQVTCFSFDPIKNITCGEGGGIVFHDQKQHLIAEKMRVLGIDKDTWSRYKNQRTWVYDVVSEGYRYHMPNFCAAIGLQQIKKADSFKRRKIEICERYDKAFAGLKKLSIIKTNYSDMFPFMYVILSNERDDFIKYMNGKNIGTGIQYIPAHHFSYCARFERGRLNQTERISCRNVTLPLFPDMKEEEVIKVIDAVCEYDKSIAVFGA